MGPTERNEEAEISLSLKREVAECKAAEPRDEYSPAVPPAFYPHVTFRRDLVVFR